MAFGNEKWAKRGSLIKESSICFANCSFYFAFQAEVNFT